jgi:pimeloyl-ACP methyl ester carboxylesterase
MLSRLPQVDYLEAGASGPLVVLVHSSVSGARQWRRLMDDLKDRYRLRAVNLFGYGETPPWRGERLQTLDDQARLVEAAVPADAGDVYLVGHSFGGAVAMQAAVRFGRRARKLVLLEANPFALLAQAGRRAAILEAMNLADMVKSCGGRGEWEKAAETFADYWTGQGSWRAMPPERRAAFIKALPPNVHEWDAALYDTTTAAQWAAALPRDTLAIHDPATVLPVREIAAILRRHAPGWSHREVAGGGHMAPLTRPDLINPLIGAFLGAA